MIDSPYEGLEIPAPEIYLPEHLLDVFCVAPNFQADGTIEGAIKLNIAARDWIKGDIDFYTYTDVLEFHNLDPEDFIESRLIAYSLK